MLVSKSGPVTNQKKEALFKHVHTFTPDTPLYSIWTHYCFNKDLSSDRPKKTKTKTKTPNQVSVETPAEGKTLVSFLIRHMYQAPMVM